MAMLGFINREAIMGSSQSTHHLQLLDEEDEQQQRQHEDEDEDEEDDEQDSRTRSKHIDHEALVKKLLQQEPEMHPFHASASPLSPQLSTHNTPRTAPSIKVWDPYNVLAPRPPPHPNFQHSADPAATEIYLICHGECHMSLRPDLVAGRCPDAALTPNGKRQARALAVFLKSQGVRFNVVYTSPLDRARATALSVCQELNFSEEQIQPSDALVEMSQGHWEGCQKSEVFTPEIVSLMERIQPDFSAPSGESLRQVEFRMVQFLNGRVMSFPDYKFRPDFSQPDHNIDNHDPAHWESSLQHRHRQAGFTRKKSGKSRLQIVSSSGDHEADDEMSPREPPTNQGGFVGDRSHARNPSTTTSTNMCMRYSCIGIFCHSIPIKCLVMGVLGCSPVMMDKICIDDSSVTVLQHSWKLGWQIKRLNDTSHLRLL